MVLSRLILNPRSRQVQRELADPYQLHRTIMSAFPAELPEDERVLFRVETHARSEAPVLLVQSQHHPDWAEFISGSKRAYLLEHSSLGGEQNPAVKEFNLTLNAGQRLVFRLLANPTVKRAGKRYGLTKEEEQLSWLERKLREAGCRLLGARSDRQELLTGVLYRDDVQHPLKFLAVLFEGALIVEEPEKLLDAVRNGIGSGKGLGFGLLSLAAPVS